MCKLTGDLVGNSGTEFLFDRKSLASVHNVMSGCLVNRQAEVTDAFLRCNLESAGYTPVISESDLTTFPGVAIAQGWMSDEAAQNISMVNSLPITVEYMVRKRHGLSIAGIPMSIFTQRGYLLSQS